MHRNLAALAAGFMAFGVLMVIVFATSMTGIGLTLGSTLAFAIGGFGIGFAINGWIARDSQRRFDRIAERVRENADDNGDDESGSTLRIVRPGEGAAA